MKKLLILFLLVCTFSCSNDDDAPATPPGDAVSSVSILSWENIGEECAQLDSSGRANLTITFNGSVPNSGTVLLQSKWKLVEEPQTAWRNDEPRSINLSNSNLTKSGNQLSIANGYCWGFPNSEVACDFSYESDSGETIGVVTINIARPE